MTNASTMKMSVEEMIGHYQRSIERSQQDPKRVLHCLGKLQRMHVTVKHLQSTGIGKTVNNLRKDDGEVGMVAKVLISKWKEMVSNQDIDGNRDEKKHEYEYNNEDNGKLKTDSLSSNEKKSHKNHEYVSKSSGSNSNHSHRDQYPLHEHRSPDKSNENHSHYRKYSSDDTQDQTTHSKHKHKSHSHDDGYSKSKKREHDHDSSTVDRHKNSSKHSKDDRHTRSKHENQHVDENSDKKHKTSSKDGKHSEHNKSSSSEKSSSTNKHKRRRESDHSSNSSPKKLKNDSSSSKNDEKKSSKSKYKPADDGIEIDNSMGTSFADALGMLAPIPTHSSKASSSTITPSTSGKSSSKISTVSSSASNSKTSNAKTLSKSSSSSSSAKTATPPLLLKKPKLPPLVDLAKDLPPPAECIIPNDYKPSPINHMVMDCVFKGPKQAAMLSETDSLCASTTSKNQRTKVYSGVKSGTFMNVLSLHELCIRFLQKNVDALEYTGGVPFEILKPVLERATPEQLDTFENFNPYLMEDSDCLWQQHCQRKFKAYKRQEMETWRDMYYRCLTEQESRLNKLTKNIKESQSVALPVRQTKLAYVDSMVKPPRSVIKKQNQFGTHNKIIATPAARTEALSGVASNMTRIGDVRLRTTANMRDTAQAQPSNGTFKPKKAPLMAKTLQLMKGRFKR